MQQDIVLPIINGILLCILMFIIPVPGDQHRGNFLQ